MLCDNTPGAGLLLGNPLEENIFPLTLTATAPEMRKQPSLGQKELSRRGPTLLGEASPGVEALLDHPPGAGRGGNDEELAGRLREQDDAAGQDRSRLPAARRSQKGRRVGIVVRGGEREAAALDLEEVASLDLNVGLVGAARVISCSPLAQPELSDLEPATEGE